MTNIQGATSFVIIQDNARRPAFSWTEQKLKKDKLRLQEMENKKRQIQALNAPLFPALDARWGVSGKVKAPKQPIRPRRPHIASRCKYKSCNQCLRFSLPCLQTVRFVLEEDGKVDVSCQGTEHASTRSSSE